MDIFDMLKLNVSIEEIKYFSGASGYAQDGHYNPILFLGDGGHHHLTDDRMLSTKDNKYEVFFSKIFNNKVEQPLTERKLPIYMVIFYDKDNNSIIDSNIGNELELFVFDFES